MNRTLLTAVLLSLTSLAGCAAAPAESEPSVSTADSLKEGSTCGPVLYTGEGTAETKDLAYHYAEKDARLSCRQTPTFCAVDCEAAAVKEAHCVASAVKSDDDDPVIGVTYSCTVTIAASSPAASCQVAIRCAPGYVGKDTDGDGCPDTCVPVECATAIRCAPGFVGQDTDGDSCADTCVPAR